MTMKFQPSNFKPCTRSSTFKCKNSMTKPIAHKRENIKGTTEFKKNVLHKNSHKFKFATSNQKPVISSKVKQPCQEILQQCETASRKLQNLEKNSSEMHQTHSVSCEKPQSTEHLTLKSRKEKLDEKANFIVMPSKQKSVKKNLNENDIKGITSISSNLTKPCSIMVKRCEIASMRLQNHDKSTDEISQIYSISCDKRTSTKQSTLRSRKKVSGEEASFIASLSVLTEIHELTSTPVKSCNQNISTHKLEGSTLTRFTQNCPIDTIVPTSVHGNFKSTVMNKNNSHKRSFPTKLNSANRRRRLCIGEDTVKNKNTTESQTILISPTNCSKENFEISTRTNKNPLKIPRLIKSNYIKKDKRRPLKGTDETQNKNTVEYEINYVKRGRLKNMVHNEEDREAKVEDALKRRPQKSVASSNKRKSTSFEKSNTSKNITKLKLKYGNLTDGTLLDDIALTTRKNLKRKAKSDGYKVPCRNTLKRKRYLMNYANKANENYEDDIYESKEFDFIENLIEESSNEINISTMSTPKFGICVTPLSQKCTPVFRDIISPTEYAFDRKIAEEVQYRRLIRNKNVSVTNLKRRAIPEKKKLEFSQIVNRALQKEEEIKKIINESSVMDDSYFSDLDVIK